MTDASPRFRSVLDGFPAYKPGRTPVSATGRTHKLSSNESPHQPLPSVVDAIAERHRGTEGSERTVSLWRMRSARATLEFLDELAADRASGRSVPS